MQRQLVWFSSSIICPALGWTTVRMHSCSAQLLSSKQKMPAALQHTIHDRLAKSLLAFIWLNCSRHSICSESFFLLFLWTSSHAHNRSSCHSCQTMMESQKDIISECCLPAYVCIHKFMKHQCHLLISRIQMNSFLKAFQSLQYKSVLFNRTSILTYEAGLIRISHLDLHAME